MRQIDLVLKSVSAIVIVLANINLAFGTPPVKTVFVKNEGQWSQEVLFRSIDGGIVLKRSSIEIGSLILQFDGHPDRIRGAIPGSGTMSYFIGNDPSRWKKAVPFYREVIYENIYDGIDLIVRGMDEAHFNLQWRIRPGADPEDIKLFVPHGNVENVDGRLNMGPVSFDIPRAYQGTKEVHVAYRVNGDTLSFEIGDYDETMELLIDPSVVIGGRGNDASVMDLDVFGNYIYVILNDVIDSFNVNATSEGILNNWSVVVLRIDRSTFSILSGAAFGGSGGDNAYGLDVSSDGVYVVGETKSRDFPTTTGAYDGDYNGSVYDAFVVRLSLDLGSYMAATYLGGSKNDNATDVIARPDSIYVLGFTASSNFPITPDAYDTSFNGNSDVFVSILSPDLSSLRASTFLGGSSGEITYSMDYAPNGIYISGSTNSGNFPVSSTAYDTSYNGSSDIFVSRLSHDLSTLIAATYVGGSQYDYCNDIVVYGGNVYATGYTTSKDFPITPGAYDSTAYQYFQDAFVIELDSNLTDLLGSTYLGGSSNDWAYGIGISSDGVYVTGRTRSGNFPTTPGAYDRTYNGGDGDVFVSRFNSNLTELLSSTYIGGRFRERAISIEISSGKVYITGNTSSPNFPANTYDTTWLKMKVGFVAELNTELSIQRSTFLDTAYVAASVERGSVGNLVFYDDALYLLGYTDGLILPLGVHDTLHSRNQDVFVLKMDADNLDILSGIHIGGSDNDMGFGIEVTSDGVYITGETLSRDFPVTPGSYDTSTGPRGDAFVSKINLDLTSLLASTYLGGSSSERGEDLIITPDAVYVVGATKSSDFPTTSGAYDEDYNDTYYDDVFVSKLDKNLSSLLASTYIGGSKYDHAFAIAKSSTGIYIIGNTASSEFPFTPNAYDTTRNGYNDVFVSKFSFGLDSLLSSTFLGGSSTESGSGIAFSSGGVYVVGYTSSNDFPTTFGIGSLEGGDLFVSKFDADLTTLSASARIGGSRWERANEIALNSGNVYVVGHTYSDDFPVTSNAYDESFNGTQDAVVLMLNSDLDSLLGSTYLGGSSKEWGGGIAISPNWI